MTEPIVSEARLNGECKLKITYASVKPDSLKVEDAKQKFQTGNGELHVYHKERDSQNEDGSLEVELVLAAKPESNIFTFTVEAENLDFYYQDELTEHDTQEVILRNNRIKGAIEFDGIVVFANANHVIVDGNIIDGATRNGISVMALNVGGTDYYGRNVTIVNNDIRNVGSKPGNGIALYGDEVEATLNDNIVSGNRVFNAGVYGIELYTIFRCAVIGNTVNLPARTTANSSGIALYSARRCTVTGNIIYGDANVDYGIEEIGVANYNAIVGNVSNKPHLIIGANTQDGHNV